MIIPVILAAGESSRMGSAKPLAQIKGKTFLEHIIKILRSSKAGPITIVLGDRAEEVLEKVDTSGCNVIINEDYEKGQLSSLREAILNLPEDVDGVLVCLVDHPYIKSSLINTLIDDFYESDKQIIVPTFEGKRGHPAIFSQHMFPHILAANLEVGAREVLWNNPDEIMEVDVGDAGILKDIDYPEDI